MKLLVWWGRAGIVTGPFLLHPAWSGVSCGPSYSLRSMNNEQLGNPRVPFLFCLRAFQRYSPMGDLLDFQGILAQLCKRGGTMALFQGGMAVGHRRLDFIDNHQREGPWCLRDGCCGGPPKAPRHPPQLVSSNVQSMLSFFLPNFSCSLSVHA